MLRNLCLGIKKQLSFKQENNLFDDPFDIAWKINYLGQRKFQEDQLEGY